MSGFFAFFFFVFGYWGVSWVVDVLSEIVLLYYFDRISEGWAVECGGVSLSSPLVIAIANWDCCFAEHLFVVVTKG